MPYLQNLAEFFPFVDQNALLSFLNSTQSGQAHVESHTQPLELAKHLAAAFAMCVVQMALFCLLRPVAKKLYQPRSFCVPAEEKVENLGSGLFTWIWPICKIRTLNYLQLGLDTYFFLRFIQVLLIFFVSCGLLNIVVLVPVNVWSTRDEVVRTDFQRLSISASDTRDARILNFHFFCMVATVLLFNFMVFREMQAVVEIKHAFMESISQRNSATTRTLLVANVPKDSRNLESLQKKFNIFPRGLETAWFIDDFSRYDCLAHQAKDALDVLETTGLICLKRTIKSSSGCDPKHHLGYPPIYIGPAQLPYFHYCIGVHVPGFFRWFVFQKRVDLIEWASRRLEEITAELDRRREVLRTDDFDKENKVFIRFKNVSSARMAHQVLLLRQQGTFDRAIIDVNPKDLIWINLRGDNRTLFLIKNYAIALILVLIMALWVIPVSIIGLVSQIPFTTLLFPFLGFLKTLPEEVRTLVTSFLPSVLLNLLSYLQLHVFRLLLTFQGTWTYSELQLKLQRWHFAFLFIHQFLVVSISSSITVVFLQVFDLPASIPKMLAANLPSAANFFYKHLAVKALSLCGAGFLRIGPLIAFYLYYPWIDRTPRAKFLRATTLPDIKWGYIYPVVSVYGAIGITYSIISPLISACMAFVLLVVLLHYKYALKYIYARDNVFETYGKMYPKALLDLYWGVYCLECCMMGIFFSQRDANGDNPTRPQGLLTFVLFLMTIFTNHAILHHYSRHFDFSAVMTDAAEDVKTEEFKDESLLYGHPCYRTSNPVLWLPDDGKYADQEVRNLCCKSKTIAGGTTRGAELRTNGIFWKTKIITGPPGHE